MLPLQVLGDGEKPALASRDHRPSPAPTVRGDQRAARCRLHPRGRQGGHRAHDGRCRGHGRLDLPAHRRHDAGPGRHPRRPRGSGVQVGDVLIDSDNPGSEAVRTGEPVVLIGSDEIARRYPDLEQAAEGERSIICLPRWWPPVGAGWGSSACRSRAGGRSTMPRRSSCSLLANTCAMTLDRLRGPERSRGPGGQAGVPSQDQCRSRRRPGLRGHAGRGRRGRGALVRRTGARSRWRRTDCCARCRWRTPTQSWCGLVEELQTRYPPRVDPERGAYKVLRTGVSELVPGHPRQLLERLAEDEEHLRLLRRLELRSGLSCALKVRDRIFGVISWVSGEGGRRFTLADQAFGEDLAQRAAVAIDNAQLHSQVRDVALAAAAGGAARAAPRTARVELQRSAYQPAGRTDAGGDFYDVVPLADGRVAMFVGDVMGRGVEAAVGDGADARRHPHPRRRGPDPAARAGRHGPGFRDPAPRPARHHGLRPRRPEPGPRRRSSTPDIPSRC